MTVRKYKNRHNASFLQLVRSMADERWVYDAIDSQLQDMYYYEDSILNNEDYITLVMENPVGDVAGFIVGTIRNKAVDVMVLFVDKLERTNGYGRLLLQQLTKYAFELNKEKITSMNNYSNPIGLRLQNSLGWTIIPVGVDEDGETDFYRAELVFANKTINEWDALSGMRTLDPDGYDRTDQYLTLRQYSYKEYIINSQRCTLQMMDAEKYRLFIKNNGETNESN